MRFNSIVILFCCVIIITVDCDKRKDNDIEETKSQKPDNTKRKENYSRSDSKNECKGETNLGKKYFINKRIKSNDESDESNEYRGESQVGKKTKQKKPIRQQNIAPSKGEDRGQPKKFIGRIERGKVKVLRKKENGKDGSESDETEEDFNEKVCKKSKHGQPDNCYNSDDSSEGEQNIPKKKIKYSIKFQHEKDKRKIENGDSSIMRLHKSGKRKNGYNDNDSDSSEEDEDQFPKRFHLADDEDD